MEYGLEPHRLTRLLNSLGARETPPPLQVFLTIHSPVAVLVLPVSIADDIQSMVRAGLEAFLARSVIACEGASEIELIRGLDHYWTALNDTSMLSTGTAFVNMLVEESLTDVF